MKVRLDSPTTLLLTKVAKHIDFRYHYIREQVADETIVVAYVETRKQLADVLKKAEDGETFQFCIQGCGLGIVPEFGV
jgi:hypothetical protein